MGIVQSHTTSSRLMLQSHPKRERRSKTWLNNRDTISHLIPPQNQEQFGSSPASQSAGGGKHATRLCAEFILNCPELRLSAQCERSHPSVTSCQLNLEK